MPSSSKLLLLSVFFLLSGCGAGGGSSTSSGSGSSSSGAGSSSSSSSGSTFPPADVLNTEYLSGGDATVNLAGQNAFSKSPKAIEDNLNDDAIFKSGNILFRNPHSGEGPLLNNQTCQGCHIDDGRGNPPANSSQPMTSMLVKLSLGNNSEGETIPDPIYGTQLQVFGLSADDQLIEPLHNASTDDVTIHGEAFAFIKYENVVGEFPDGTQYTLQKPTYFIRDASYGQFAEGLLISPRIAPSMIGLGLLEAIPQERILDLADPEDSDNDGISGKAKYVRGLEGDQVLGRFGWKASTGSVLQQTSGAYRFDMGMTNRFNPTEDCMEQQGACLARAQGEKNVGDAVDISDLELAFVEFYSRLLAVPQRRGYDVETKEWDDNIKNGRDQFVEIGCASCHVQYHKTTEAKASILGVVEGLSSLVESDESIDVLTNQDIWPYTDLLVHDMGGSCQAIVRENENGESCEDGAECLWVQRCDGLADGRPDGMATDSEWRTTPLWGLGLVKTVNPNAGFLHDGRARTIEEAILWHGGEAESSKNAYMNLSSELRREVLDFLESL